MGETARSGSSDTTGSTGSTGDRLAPTLELWRTVQVIERWAQRTMHRRSGTTLSPNETHLLARLATEPSQRMSDLAQWQHVDRSTMTLQIGKLAERDLVRRVPDPRDGRAQLVELTDVGREQLDAFLSRSAEVLREAVAGWTDMELDRFGIDLQRFARDLDGILDEQEGHDE